MKTLAMSRIPVCCDADARHNLSADAFVLAGRIAQAKHDGFRAAAVDYGRTVVRIANDLIAASQVSP